MIEEYKTFSDINQARLSLKMVLADYSWFRSVIIVNKHGWVLEVNVNAFDPRIEHIVPKSHRGMSIHVNMPMDKTRHEL